MYEKVTITEDNVSALITAKKLIIQQTEIGKTVQGDYEDGLLGEYSPRYSAREKWNATLADKELVLGKVVYIVPLSTHTLVSDIVPMGVM
jgi:hypothetical protein